MQDKMALNLLLLVAILGAFPQMTYGDLLKPTDMNGQLFLFPEESRTSYVLVEANLPAPVKSFTVCLRTFTELTRGYSLFSGNNPKQDNDLLLYLETKALKLCTIAVGADQKGFNTLVNITERNHFCASWDSSAGLVQLWLNGKPSVRKVLKKGYNIQKTLKVILGQEQDSYGGSFDEKQSFVGELGDVHMWDYVLSPTDIQQVMFNNREFSGNVINWRALRFEMKGHVLVVPVQQTSNWHAGK